MRSVAAFWFVWGVLMFAYQLSGPRDGFWIVLDVAVAAAGAAVFVAPRAARTEKQGGA